MPGHLNFPLSVEAVDLLIEAAGDGVWDWDMAQPSPRFMGSFYDDFELGQISTRLTEGRWTDLMHPDDLDRTLASVNAYRLQPQGTMSVQFRLRDKSGCWRWIESRGKALEINAKGRAQRLIGVHYDQTARREAELVAQAEQAKFLGIFLTLPDAAGCTRVSDGTYIEVNPAFERVFGHPRNEVIGKSALQLKIWPNQGERERMLAEFALKGVVDRMDISARAKDGRVMPGQMSVSGAVINQEACLVWVYRDLTQEKKIEAELTHSKAILDAAGRMGRLGAWVVYADPAIPNYWSPICRELTGVGQHESLGSEFLSRFVAPEFHSAVFEASRLAFKKGIGWDYEVQVLRADGHRLWVRSLCEPVLESGKVTQIQGVLQDIDASRQALNQLRMSEERFVDIFKYLPQGLSIADAKSGHYMDVNPAWERLTGVTRAQALGKTVLELGLVSPADAALIRRSWPDENRVSEHEVPITCRDGSIKTLFVSIKAMSLNGVNCWITMHQDVTQSRKTQAQIKEREEQLSLSVAAANLGTWDLDVVKLIGFGNPRWRELRGLKPETEWIALAQLGENTYPEDLAKMNAAFRAQFHNSDRMMEFVTRVIWPDKSVHWIRDLGKVVSRDANGRATRMLGMTIDVTEQHRQQDQLEHLAHYDALTGLPNRVLLADRMKQAMAHAERSGELLGVVYLDLDGFKPINDRLGHSAGDELLKRMAARLPLALRGEDSVARLGGDEFVLLLTSLKGSADCELAMQRALAAICEAHVINGETVGVTASMGVTLYPQDPSDADTLLRHADQAMYIAKQGGRNRYHFFDTHQEQATQRRSLRTSELANAMRSGQFALYLQPRVNMRLGHVVGAEALVRWQHPTLGLLSPAHFLPEIEASELNIEFGQWVIDSALQLMQRWHDQQLPLALSINITARHLQVPDFSTQLAHKLAQYPSLLPDQLEIEITESGSLSDLDAAVSVIHQLHGLGVQVSLDDFGTGYSSLTYLRRLPVDTLKIDQSFVRDMLIDPDDRAIVQGVISLAASFAMDVVAEGVESQEQGAQLLRMGCDLAQGYGIARPMPEADLPGWVKQWVGSALWGGSGTAPFN